MPQNVTQYDLLISCPGDIKEEIEIIDKVVDRFNQQFTDVLGISIRTKHWKKSSFSQSGDTPQNLLNKQFAMECDAAVAIFWTRFGTPTDEYGSGTEEEIEHMLAMGKQVFMYFSHKPIDPDNTDGDEIKRIRAFRERYKGKGIYDGYSSDDEFEKLFFAHLSSYFLSQKKISEIKNIRNSNLLLKGIAQDDKLSDTAQIQKFYFPTHKNSDYYLKKIKSLYTKIKSKRVDSPARMAVPHIANLFPVVEIEDKKQKVIKGILESIGYQISDDFFNLGNLKRDLYSASLVNYQIHYQGTNDEKEKHKLLQELYETIIAYYNWKKYEQAFTDRYVIRLALQNDGTDYDEDVEITLRFPKESLLPHTEFPQFDNDTMDLVLHEYGLNNLFGITDTAEFKDYEYSIQKHSPTTYTGVDLPFAEPDYTEPYNEELDDIFCYSTYIQEDGIIISLKVDYIKQHTTIAFPSVLFLNHKLEEIDYSISSKNSPTVIKGKIKIISD